MNNELVTQLWAEHLGVSIRRYEPFQDGQTWYIWDNKLDEIDPNGTEYPNKAECLRDCIEFNKALSEDELIDTATEWLYNNIKD